MKGPKAINYLYQLLFALLLLTGCAEVKSIPVRLYRAAFTVESPGLSTATVWDAGGKEVRVLWKEKAVPAGTIELAWDGRDEKGDAAPAGEYRLALEIHRWNLKALDSFGGLGSTPGRFLNPQGLCAYPQGARLTVAVADTGNQRVQVLTDTGGFLLSAGNFGSGDDSLNHPTDVDWDGQFLTVCDSQNHRLARFDNQGNYLGEISRLTGLQTSLNRPLDLSFEDPRCIAKDGGAAFWVSDQGQGILFQITSTGGVLQELGNPFPLSNEGPFFQLEGDFFIRSGKAQVQVLDANGNNLKEVKAVPAFQEVGGMAASDYGFGLISDSQEGLLHLVDKDGNTFGTLTAAGTAHPGALSLWEDQLFVIDDNQNMVFHYQLLPAKVGEMEKKVTVQPRFPENS